MNAFFKWLFSPYLKMKADIEAGRAPAHRLPKPPPKVRDVHAAIEELREPTSLRGVQFDIDVKAHTHVGSADIGETASPVDVEPEYTDWFPPDVKPVHVGFYESGGFQSQPWAYEPGEETIRFYWDGHLWLGAEGGYIVERQGRWWRGLAHDPSAGHDERFALTAEATQ